MGLPGQLPPGLQVAHKEGDMTGVGNDVGIVFSSHRSSKLNNKCR
ncbi:MAG: serine hydrolase [Firmicutes bacterium]|nr:serine hydrolase [Bacillota bacterium]